MTQIEIKDLKNGEVEISGSIPNKILEKHRPSAIKNISKDIEIAGFRKGHIPEKVLAQKVGENTILEEMAEMTLKEEFPKIIKENSIETIGQPNISITKLANGNPFEFKATIAVMPKIELPDYKSIAKKIMSKKEAITVTEKEIDETIDEIRKMRVDATEGKTTEPKNLPEINDDFVKTLGDFKNVADFREKLKKNILEEKNKKEIGKKRVETIEKITNESKIILPEVIIEGELNNMLLQFKDDVARGGGKFEEYLEHIKKTEGDLRKEWRTDAEKKAKSQLILSEIATKENITAPKKESDEQVSLLLNQYKDADKDRVRIYVENILVNEETFKFLEKQAK